MPLSNQDLYHNGRNSLLSINERSLAEKFTISWNARMRSAAGRAMLQTLTVEINPKLQQFGTQEVLNTVLHEIAHLVAWSRSRHRGHGAPWKQACADLGIPGEKATHTLPLPRNTQKKKWLYTCKSCDLSVKRTRRMKRRSACAAWCKKYNKGRYTERYILKELALVSEGN